jgi:large subunit ribosomal protein L46
MYVPGPIRTEADERNDTKSLDRSLRERLYFVTKRNAKASKFGLPQTLVTSDDVAMREYAELALQSSFPPGEDRLCAHFMSHMPATHLEHIYAEDFQAQSGYFGVKMFFYRAQLIAGEVGNTAVADYAWARESELPELLSAETLEAIKPILFGVSNNLDQLKLEYIEGDDAAKW